MALKVERAAPIIAYKKRNFKGQKYSGEYNLVNGESRDGGLVM
jgi:hypothetical protein